MFKKIHVFRVMPDEEVLGTVTRYCEDEEITSGIVIGVIGSARNVKLNYIKELPGKYVTESYEGPLEIVGAQGSIALNSDETIVHIHIQLSSQETCFGGHLVEATVFSTAEVMIGELDYQLNRYPDEYTGLKELRS